MKTILQLASGLLLFLLPLSAAITNNGSVSWIRTAAPGAFNASGSDKLVVVVSGEHNFTNNYTGTCSAVTYNGQALTQALLQAPANPASGGHGQTHSSIWYLDNPGNFSGSNTIVVTCNGTSWVATAIGLSGTLPGVGATAKQPGSASTTITAGGYGSLIIAACGMGGQGNTATPLPGVIASVPSSAITLAGLKIGSNWAGHAVASAEVTTPSAQTCTFNTAKTDVVTVAAAFQATNPTMPAGPTPMVRDIVPGESVELVWSNFLPNSGSNVWVDVWIGDSPANLQRVVNANPAGLNLTSTLFTAPAPGVYHGRIDSYLQGTPSGTPHPGTPFSFEVIKTGLRMDTWLGLRPLPSLILLQREGIAQRPPDSSLRHESSSLGMTVPGGVRLRGLFTPESPGSYKFHISGSQNTALWLSPDDSRFNKQRIACSLNPSAIGEWNKFPSQTSAPIELQENVSYYIEAQVMSSIGGGHLEIGWTPPGATTPSAIPVTLLSCPPADPDDSNENNLPNSWEEDTELDVSSLPGALAEYGDPDNDGISNFDEHQLNSNPLAKDALADGLTRDTWTNITSGWKISDFTADRAVFLNYPNETTHVPAIDDNARGEYYCSRYRGFITAPVTGYYRFWIAGNKKAELWLADGTVKYPGTTDPLTNRFGKQRIALNADPEIWTANARYDFDQYPEQRSRVVYLVEYQRYYIEALHKQRENPAVNHVAVAWQVPGQPRTLIPASAFTSDVPDDNDPDGDFLPSAWETLTPSNGKPAHNLNPADSGLTDANNGQFGDPDGDGMTNFEEFQLGTHPRLADTDADGLSDKAERDYYHTNPLVSNAIAYGPASSIPAHNFASATGNWSRDASGTLTAVERRGTISYPFTISSNPLETSALQPGVLEVVFTGSAAGIPRSKEYLPLVFSIGGDRFATATLTSLNGGNATVTVLTPSLKAGSHTLEILHDNYRADLQLRIASITLRNVGGEDLDNNQRPDWLDQRLAADNRLTRIPTSSLTSPVCIEGITSDFPGLALSRSVGSLPTTHPEIFQSIDSSFYSNIPLDDAGDTNLSISFQSGASTDSRAITWAATNLCEHTALDIRAGDSLRLDASDATHTTGTYTVKINGVLLADSNSMTDHPVGQPFKATFDTPGTYNLVAVFSDETPETVTRNLILRVHSASFGPAFAVRANYKRYWTPATLGADIVVENDSRLTFKEDTAATSARSFWVTPFQAGARHVIARLPASADGTPGAILTRGTIAAFYFAFLDETSDSVIVTTYPDGTHLMRGSVVAVGLPPEIIIRLTGHYQGTTFIDGATQMDLTAADFDQNGIALIYYEHAGPVDSYMCTYVNIYTTTP